MRQLGALEQQQEVLPQFDARAELAMLAEHSEIWKDYRDSNPEVAAMTRRLKDHLIMYPHHATTVAVIGLSGDSKSSTVEGLVGELANDDDVHAALEYHGRELYPVIYTTATGVLETIRRKHASLADWGNYPPEVFVEAMTHNRNAMARMQMAQGFADQSTLLNIADVIAAPPSFQLVRSQQPGSTFVYFNLTNPEVQGIAQHIREGYWDNDPRRGMDNASEHGIHLDVDTTNVADLDLERYSQGNADAIALTIAIQRADMIRRLASFRHLISSKELQQVTPEDIATDDNLQYLLQPFYYHHIARDVCRLPEGRYTIGRPVRATTDVHHHHRLMHEYHANVGTILNARKLERLIP